MDKEMFLFIGEVEYYDEDKGAEIPKKVVVRASTFVEAVQQIEGWYGNALTSLNLTMVEDQLITICDECYEKLLKGDIE